MGHFWSSRSCYPLFVSEYLGIHDFLVSCDRLLPLNWWNQKQNYETLSSSCSVGS